MVPSLSEVNSVIEAPEILLEIRKNSSLDLIGPGEGRIFLAVAGRRWRKYATCSGRLLGVSKTGF